MKTAGRRNPNRWANVSGNRAHGVVGQNTSFSFKGAAKQEKFQSLEKCFLLTSPFIELITGDKLKPSDWDFIFFYFLVVFVNEVARELYHRLEDLRRRSEEVEDNLDELRNKLLGEGEGEAEA